LDLKLGCKGWPRGAELDYRVAVSFILPVSQLTEKIVYQTHITRFSAVLTAEIHRVSQITPLQDYLNIGFSG